MDPTRSSIAPRIALLAVSWAVASCGAPSTTPTTPTTPAPPTVAHLLGSGAAWPLVDEALQQMVRRRGERFTLLLPAEGESYRCEFDGPGASLTCDGETHAYGTLEALVRAVDAGAVHQELTLRRLADEPGLRARGVVLKEGSIRRISADTVQWTSVWRSEAEVRRRESASCLVPVSITVRPRGLIEAQLQLESGPQAVGSTSVAGFVDELRGTLTQRSKRESDRRRDAALARALDGFFAPLSRQGSALGYADLTLGATRTQIELRYKLSPPNFDWEGRREWLALGAGRCPGCTIKGITHLILVDQRLARFAHELWLSPEVLDGRPADEMCQALGVELQRRLGAGLAGPEGEPCTWRMDLPGGHLELSRSGSDHVEMRLEPADYAETARRTDHAIACRACQRLRVGQMHPDEGVIQSIDVKACTMEVASIPAGSGEPPSHVMPCRDIR